MRNKAANAPFIFEEIVQSRFIQKMAERSFPLATTAPQRKRGGAHSFH